MNLFELFGTIAITGAAQAQSDIKSTSEQASSFGEKLKSGIGTVAKWGATIGTAAAGATKALVSMATSSAETTDNIDKMSQKIGISREAYQELDFICSQSGTSVDTLQTGIKSLTAAMDGAASGTASNVEEFEKLGVAVTNSDGSLRSQEDVMWDTMKALQKMDNQTEKARLATELFGRSGTELMPLLNGAAGSIDEMKQQAHDLGLVLADETIDSGVELTDTMDQMKRAISSLVTKLGANLMPIVTKLCNFIINNLPNIEKMFDQLSPVLEGLFDDLLPILTDLVSELLPILMDLISSILPVLSQIIKSILPIFVDLIKTIVPPLAEIIQTLLPVLTSVLDILLPIVQGLLDVLKPILDVVVAILQPIIDLVGKGLNALADAFGLVKEKTDPAIEAARQEAQAMDDVRIAADNARAAVDEKATQELAAVSTTESLWKELQTLADEQGNVAEKDKARADFITNQLSEALGIEIGWTGNQIQNYKDLQTEIDNTIEKKKAEILLAASEENYKVAIQNRTEAENNLNTALQARDEAVKQRDELEAQYQETLENGTWAEKLYAEAQIKQAQDVVSAKQEAYANAKLTVEGYYNDIAEYEEAQTLVLQGETDKAIELLSNQGQAFKSAADLAEESAEDQKAILQKQMEDAALKMNTQNVMYEKMAKNGTEAQKKVAEDALKDAQDYFTKASQEYQKAGGEIGSDFFKSISDKMTEAEFEKLGVNLLDGIVNGMSGNKVKLAQQYAQIMHEATSGSSGSVTVTTTASTVPKMAQGGVLKKGQIGFLEGDGDEAVVPLSQNTQWIDRVAAKLNINSANSGGNNSEVVGKLNELIKAITSMNIVLDTGTMVGEMAPAMDAQLGDIYTAKERGR